MKIMQFSKEVWDKSFRRMFALEFPDQKWSDAADYHFAHVAFHPESKEILGFLTLKETGKRAAFICYGAINPWFRNSKVGTNALEQLVHDMWDRYDVISLMTDTSNLAMNFLAQKTGFRLVGQEIFNEKLHNFYEKRGIYGITAKRK